VSFSSPPPSPPPFVAPPIPAPAPMMTPTSAKPQRKPSQPSFISSALFPSGQDTGGRSLIGGAPTALGG
jgi:hypothetical protein